MKKQNYSDNELEFMQSLSSAILQRSPKKISIVLSFWLLSVSLFLTWSYFAEIDELTRGQGKVVPYGDNQVVQNLEGGIVESIDIRVGDTVDVQQTLVKIKNTKSLSTFETNELKTEALKAKAIRLEAESTGKKFPTIKTDNPAFKELLNNERKLYNANKKEIISSDKVVVHQIEKEKHDVKETQKRIEHLKMSLSFVEEEVAMTEPMVIEGIKSKVDFLKLKREANELERDLDSAILTLPKLQSSINELRQKRKEIQLNFRQEANKELNDFLSEIQQLERGLSALGDEVSRTVVRSPVHGTIQKLYIHTVGGVIKPGEDLVEIVPITSNLLLEVKIKPSDIAFIYPGQKAIVKISAYDFAIYGALVGEVVSISPDTITDEKDDTYYVIHIKTDKNYLGSEKDPHNISPGMTCSVDIATGKKSVLNYILKPILKSKQYVFSER